MPVNLLRVGVVGLGVGQAHAEALARVPGCRVTRLCDMSIEKRAWARRRFPRAEIVPRAEAVVGHPAVDAVVLASYDQDHAGQVATALRAGQHVFVEKPLCRTEVELTRIHRLWRARRGRTVLMSNLVLRAAPLFRWLRRRLAAGGFGRVYAVDGDYLYGRLKKITTGWRRNVPGYSVMAGGGIHLVDLLLWLTGERPRSVWAAGNRICAAGTGFAGDDFLALTARLPSGAVARITANFGCVHGHQHTLRVFGTRGTFLLDDAGPRVQTRRDPAPPARPVRRSARPAHKGALIPEFIRAARAGREDPARARGFFDGVSVCLAAERSRRSRREEEVRYL
jgi:predicted dehydrogenase